MAETLAHPVFGELRWDRKRSWWFTHDASVPAAKRLDVIVNPGDEDRFAFLEPAAKLYRRALKAERRILRDAIREELLELHNDVWRHGEPKLTAKGLMDRLELSLIDIDTIVPLTICYEAGPLFGGHSVAVETDDELQFTDADLRG
jgi:hypothetical protein